jgi:hypothetical protein
MVHKIIISQLLIFFSLAFAGDIPAQTVVYDASNFSAAGRLLQPVPSGHTPGKDNGPGTGTHNAGEDCGICHTPGGKAGNFLFTVGGTVYEDRTARRTLKGAEIILQDVNGTVISMTSNEAGNFWTFAPIASNPCAISSHGSTTDYLYTLNNGVCVPTVSPSDSRTWQYKTWVKFGDQVRHMATIAPIGGSSASSARMGCSMHHAGMGSRGGLWGMKKDTLASYPSSSLSFKKHILPIFRNKCAPCHIPGSTLTRLATMSDIDATAGALTMVDYSNGRDFTSYAGSTVGTTVKIGISDLTVGYQSDPDSSPVLFQTLLQPSGTVTHAGGGFWIPADGDYKAIRQWIAEGAQP